MTHDSIHESSFSYGASTASTGHMIPTGRLLIILGIVFLVVGLLLSYSHFFSFLHLGRLPGDVRIRRGSFVFYFPLTTCILISIFITLVIYLFRK